MTAHARVIPTLWSEIMTADDMRREMDDLAPMLVATLNRRDSLALFTPQDVLDRCVEGRYQMWGVYRPALLAFCVTGVDTYPLARVLNFLLAGGHDMAAWLPEIHRVHGWARGLGCTVAQVYGRRGWARALRSVGYTHQRDVWRMAL